MKVATILDEFSEACFSHEFDLLRLRQDDFKEKLTKNKDISFLLVESAWRGSGKSWCLAASGARRNPQTYPNLDSILAICRKRHIPTVFWNKEDPAHYGGFIQVAKKFNYVFTSDFGSKINYHRDLRHKKVYTLPFAAQPKLHWPQDLSSRNNSCCFAGTYWSRIHKKRAQDMEHVLSPALKYNLEIYDRNKLTGTGEKWPGKYRTCIKGGLPYNRLVNAYRKYRVFMNVNCIVDSHTMFSRRVFELLACGTPVISAYALGISNLLPSVCLTVNSRDTLGFLNTLLTDNEFWNTTSISGIRTVYEQHTYAHRLAYICKNINIPVPEQTDKRIGIYQQISQMDPFNYDTAKELILNG